MMMVLVAMLAAPWFNFSQELILNTPQSTSWAPNLSITMSLRTSFMNMVPCVHSVVTMGRRALHTCQKSSKM